MNVLWFGAAHLKLPPGVHHGCHCRPGSWTTALWDTGHPEMMTLMNLSAPCPVAPIRSILLGNKCVWLTQTKHTPHSHTNTHTHSNTHFPRPPLCAPPLIPIGLSLWLQIFFTCSEIMLKLRGHNKSAQLLVVGSEKPQTAQARIFINMICETFQTTKKSCAACGWRRNHIPLCCVWSFLYCVYNADSRGVCLNASQCAHMHAGSLSQWRGVWKQSWEDGSEHRTPSIGIESQVKNLCKWKKKRHV